MARRVLAKNVRLGRPVGVAGLPEAAKGAAFSTAVGLLIYPQVAGAEQAFSTNFHQKRSSKLTGTGGAFARVGQWLKESF